MGERPVGVTDVASGAGVADFRTRERSVGGNTVCEQYLLYESERVRSGKCMATTFRTTGVFVDNTNLASLFNRTGSGVLVAVSHVAVQNDPTVNSTPVKTTVSTRITTNPTTGTLLTPVLFDTAGTHASLVEFRGATASDGGAATTLTATPGDRTWGQIAKRMASVARPQRINEKSLVPDLSAGDPAFLREGEGLLITNVEAALSSTFWLVQAVWEEFLLP